MFACKKNKPKIIKFLIDNKADVHKLNRSEENALFYTTNNLEIIQLLIDKGININQINKYNRNILYDMITRYGYDTQVIKFFIDHKVEINGIWDLKKQETILILAIRKNNFEIAKLLIENKVNIHEKEKINGYNALFTCIKQFDRLLIVQIS